MYVGSSDSDNQPTFRLTRGEKTVGRVGVTYLNGYHNTPFTTCVDIYIYIYIYRDNNAHDIMYII